jgi:hypothetical protein
MICRITRARVLVVVGLIAAFVAFGQDRPQEVREKRQRELWAAIKRALISGGAKYFEENLLNAAVPELKGTVVSGTPAENPESIVIALSDKTAPEVTLRFVERTPGKPNQERPARFGRPLDPGDEVEFTGIPTAFSEEPFMLTFTVSLDEPYHLKHQPQPKAP